MCCADFYSLQCPRTPRRDIPVVLTSIESKAPSQNRMSGFYVSWCCSCDAVPAVVCTHRLFANWAVGEGMSGLSCADYAKVLCNGFTDKM